MKDISIDFELSLMHFKKRKLPDLKAHNFVNVSIFEK